MEALLEILAYSFEETHEFATHGFCSFSDFWIVSKSGVSSLFASNSGNTTSIPRVKREASLRNNTVMHTAAVIPPEPAASAQFRVETRTDPDRKSVVYGKGLEV